MNPEAKDLWQRAKRALQTAQSLVEDDPDTCASRAYYAVFYGVSAYFASIGQHFTKHTGVQAAVHREL